MIIPKNRLDVAVTLARRGIPVLVVYGIRDGKCTCGEVECGSPGKHPILTGGYKSATTDDSRLRSWLSRWPDSNIAVQTGTPGGVMVVDIDTKSGGVESLRRLERKYGRLSRRFVVQTGGGFHIYLRMPQMNIRSGVDVLGRGIDIRAVAGYAVFATSQHVSGVEYRLAVGTCLETDFPDAPSWLSDLLVMPVSDAPRRPRRTWNSDVCQGSRNATVASLAGVLFGNRIDVDLVFVICRAYNAWLCKPPLDLKEVDSVTESILRCESRKRGA